MYRTFTGTDSEYRELHYWVERQLGKPSICDRCGTMDAKKFEWANISGEYRKDASDWQRLCTRCHHLLDYNNMCRRKLHALTEDNTYVTPSTGKRECFSCKIIRREAYKRRLQCVSDL